MITPTRGALAVMAGLLALTDGGRFNATALTHYVVIAQDAVDVVVFDRESGFNETRYRSAADVIEFTQLGISLSLSEIYRDTGLV